MRNLGIVGRLLALGGMVATLGVGLAFAQQAAKPVRVGIFLPLTGPAAAGGAANRLGYEMAISEINAAGGIVGRPIVTVYGDDQGDPTVGVGEIKRLIFQEHVDVVVGTQNSQIELAALPVLNEGKVAAISLAGSSALTPVAGPYHFSLAPSATTLGSAMVEFAAKDLKPKNSALIYDDGAAAKSGVEGIKATLTEMKTPITGEQQYKFHPSDVTPQLLSLRRGNPDILYLFSASQDDIGIILKNAQEIDWSVKIVGSLAVGASGALATRVAGPHAFDNTIAQTFERFTYCASAGVGSPIVSDFIKKVQAYSKSTTARADYFNIANGYDSVYIFKTAIEKAGASDGPTLAAWIEQHASEMQVLSAARLVASKGNHFLVGPDGLTMVVHPELRNEQGLQKRAGAC
jgi:branched-chain amino acid transport system substrate-binding protein